MCAALPLLVAPPPAFRGAAPTPRDAAGPRAALAPVPRRALFTPSAERRGPAPRRHWPGTRKPARPLRASERAPRLTDGRAAANGGAHGPGAAAAVIKGPRSPAPQCELRRRREGNGRQRAPQAPCALPAPAFQHESFQPRAVRAEERPFGAQPGHLPQQDPGGRPHEPAVQHERLLLQAEGAGAQHPAEQEGQQDGNPAARHRLHPGPADRAGLAPVHRQPPPPAAGAERRLPDPADHAQHRHQHPLPTGSRVPLRTNGE